MRLLITTIVLIMSTALVACGKKADSAAGDVWSPFGTTAKPGRYIGVGIYSPGEIWSRIVHDGPPPAGPIKPADDQAIIVVVDSKTGEIRSCGDLSGYCVGMNPWKTPLPPSQSAPIAVQPPQPEGPGATPAGDATPAK